MKNMPIVVTASKLRNLNKGGQPPFFIDKIFWKKFKKGIDIKTGL